MKILELFAGSRCIGKAAESLGHEVFSVDWTNYPGINLSMDIEFLKVNMIPFIPDHIHWSPDCTTYTIAAISTHRNNTEPKSEYAIKCDRVNQHVIELQNYWLSIFYYAICFNMVYIRSLCFCKTKAVGVLR